MHRLRDIRLWMLLGAVIVIGLSVRVLLLQERDRASRAVLGATQTEHALMASSLLLEHVRFGNALHQYLSTGNSDERESMVERFDIYFSRYDAFDDYASRYFAKWDKTGHGDLLPRPQIDDLINSVRSVQKESPDRLIVIERALQHISMDDLRVAEVVHDQLVHISEILAVYEIQAFERTRYLARVRRAAEDEIANRLDFSIRALLGMCLLFVLAYIGYRFHKYKSAFELKQSQQRLAVKTRETDRLSRELERLSTLDGVSNLLNRRGFVEAMDKVLASGVGRHGLCVIDLDHFKVINDTCGHDVGDRLIHDVATRLKACTLESDFVGRHGADEFLVLVQDSDELAFRGRATQLSKLLQNYRFIDDERRFDVVSSIGAVHFESDDMTRDELLARANAACYVAKRTGGGRIHFHGEADGLLEFRRQELYWVERIRAALRDDHLMLYCQPIRSLVGEQGTDAYGHEILLRMINEDGSVVSPGRFLHVAERYSLATQIDRWVVDAVFDWLRANCDDVAKLGSININLSGRTIGNDDFLAHIESLTPGLPVPPSSICFELTESSLIDDQANSFLYRLRELGYRLALDDFGSGYSSFGYLESMPVDNIKIDGHFVCDVDTNPMHREFVRAISVVGKAMGKGIVAEFVSNDASIDVLREIGVDYVQGYHTGVPVPLTSVDKLRDGNSKDSGFRHSA